MFSDKMSKKKPPNKLCYYEIFYQQNIHKTHCLINNPASNQVYQLLVHGRWFSPGTPASSTTKTGRHDILLKVALKHNKLNQLINNQRYVKRENFLLLV